jgi:hypothetical protein
MTNAKRSRVLIIGAGPIVIGQAAESVARRFVDHAAGADDFAEEGARPGVVVLAGGLADGRDTNVRIAPSKTSKHRLPFAHRDGFEVRGDYGQINITPLMRLSTSVRAVQNDGLNADRAIEGPCKIQNGLL